MVESDLAPLNVGLASAYHRAQNRHACRVLVGTAASAVGQATRWWWWRWLRLGRAVVGARCGQEMNVHRTVRVDWKARSRCSLHWELDAGQSPTFTRPIVPSCVQQHPCTIRYDTIRDAILTCVRKPTWVSLIYRTQPTTKKCKNRKTKSWKQICSEITVNSPENPCSKYLRRNEGLQWEAFAEKEGFKPVVKEWVGGHQIIVIMTVGR